MIVGEVALQDLHRVVGYLESGDQLHIAHNFVFIDQDWDAEAYATAIADFEALAEETAWPAWFLANHDNRGPRSRFDHDGLGAQRARAILVMLYALRGHAVHLPGRGARAAGRGDPARPRRRRRRPRPRARADPVDAGGARLRLHHRRAVAAVRRPRPRRSTPQTQDDDPGSTLNLTRALARLRAERRRC